MVGAGQGFSHGKKRDSQEKPEDDGATAGSKRRKGPERSLFIRQLLSFATDGEGLSNALGLLAVTGCGAVSVRLKDAREFWWQENITASLGESLIENFRPIGKERWLEKAHPEDRSRVKKNTFETDLPQPMEFRHRGADGAYRMLASRSAFVLGAGGERVAVVSIYRDVTDEIERRREMERELLYRKEIETALRHESRKRTSAERVVRKQSHALSNTLNLLLRKPEHPDFVRGILRAITRECGALWATLWRVGPTARSNDRNTTFHTDAGVEKAVEDFVRKYPREMAKLAGLYRTLLDDHRCTLTLRSEDRRIPPAIRTFYKKIGVSCMMLTPLMLSNHLVGWISYLSKETVHHIDPDKVAFMEATAKQAVLAMHLKSLGETARETERARENERLAVERQEELSRVSQLLRLPLIETSGELQGVDALLKGVLQNMIALTAADSALLWKRDEDLDAHVPILAWEKGVPISILPERMHTLGELVRTKHAKLFRAWSRADEIRIEKASSPRMRRFLKDIGRPGTPPSTLIIAVPLVFNDQVLGFVLLAAFCSYRKADQRDLALRALALQTAMILRLHGLAAAQRGAALAVERNRIARDMHDLLAQSFSGITLQIEAMRAECPGLPRQVTDRLVKIRDHAGRSVDEVRRSIQMLRPALLDSHALADALTSLGRELGSAHGISIKVSASRKLPPLDSKKEIHLFAIASEAMQNAVRHAKPRLITVTLKQSQGKLRLVIADDGKGFEKNRNGSAGRQGTHFGLPNMEERAHDIGGVFSLRSSTGKGTRVQVVVPVGI